jgi:hypothetical protein
MKIYIEGYVHHKNEAGINLLQSQDFEFDRSYDENIKYDQIHIFNGIRKIEGQDCTHIYGPHFYHFDMNRYDFSEKEFMNCLSPWIVDLTMSIRQDIRCTALPFPVDVDRFIPSEKTGKPVVYFKNRDPQLLARVREYFGNDMTLIVYGSYNEGSYLQAISEAPYCVWVGCHESQGFAFQEAMSCDTPVFVINVKSLRDEWGPTMWKNFLPGHDLQATAASYFDETCGLISSEETWQEDFEEFTSKLSSYSPRDFVLNNLSPKACAEKWRNLC